MDRAKEAPQQPIKPRPPVGETPTQTWRFRDWAAI